MISSAHQSAVSAASSAPTDSSGFSRRAFCTHAATLALAGAGMLLGGCASDDSHDGDAEGQGTAEAGAEAQNAGQTGGEGAAEPSMNTGMFFAFDTVVTVKGYGVTDDMLAEVQAMCMRYDELFNAHNDKSDIGRINLAGGEPVEVDPDTADLIARSLELCELFDGDLDITVGTVSLLWDFAEGVKPADEAISEGITHVDYTKVVVDGTTVTMLDPAAKLDLGGVGKGWVADRVLAYLREQGVESGLLDLGTSSIYCLGSKPGDKPWRIALRDPLNPDGDGLGVIEAADAAIVSSGLYDQHFEVDGVDYHHILDPRTGMPARTDLLGITAVLDSSMRGDAMTTAFFVKGTQGSLDWIAAHPELDVEAVFVGEGDEMTFTEGFVDSYNYMAS